jgi:hypothetical protein
LLAAGLMAAGGAAFAEEAAKAGPKLVCAEPVFDFGTVENKESVENVFTIENKGTAPLLIAGAKSYCGCTVASISETNVAPGGTSKVTVKLSLAGRYGLQDKKVSVESNDPAAPSLMLSMRGTVFTPVEVTPERVAFSPVPPGTVSTSEVVLAAAGTNAFKVLQVKSFSPSFLAELAPVEEGKKYKIVVRTALADPRGYAQGQIAVTTDHPSRSNIQIPVSASGLAEIIVYPPEITLTTSSTGPVVRAVYLKPGTATSFEVASVETPGDITHKVLPYAGGGHRIVLENIAPDPALSGTSVKITTSVEQMKEIVLPIRVLGAAAPAKAPAAAPAP